MKIERAVLREVSLELKEPFETSRGSVHRRRVLLLTLHGEGLEGWGECVVGADPSYTAETVETAWRVLAETVLPRVVGLDLAGASTVGAAGPDGGDTSPADILLRMLTIDGHPMALATVEMALWDLVARAAGVSLSGALGGTRQRVPVGVSLGLAASIDDLADAVAGALEDGYARVKLKIAPGHDVEVLAHIRARFPTAALSADANGAYTLADAPRLAALDPLGLQMLEQPLTRDDFEGHARLQERLRTPVCLDESIGSEADAATALALASCGVINLKPGRVGGLGASRRIHDSLLAAGMPVWCGGMLETGIGRAHNLALASLRGFTLPGDISASRRYWERDIVAPEHEVADGHMRVPTGPGIGVEVDIARVDALTTRVATFRSQAAAAGRTHQGQ